MRVCVCVCLCHDSLMEVRRQSVGVSLSLIPSCEFQGFYSGRQAWWPVPFPTQPPWQAFCLILFCFNCVYLYMFGCFACMCVHTPCTCPVSKVLQIIVRHDMGAGHWTWILWQGPSTFNHRTISLALVLAFNIRADILQTSLCSPDLSWAHDPPASVSEDV